MPNEAVYQREGSHNLYLVDFPAEITASTPSGTSKNATFPNSLPAFEVREPYLTTYNSLNLYQGMYNTMAKKRRAIKGK